MKKTTKKKRKKGVATYNPKPEGIVTEQEDTVEYNQEFNDVKKTSQTVSNILGTKLTANKLQEAIVLAEVLGKPLSKRRDRRSRVGRL
ncbi:MAG: hypothetical protein ACRC1P_04000 [Cellulosilyticaceae bacterium]